MFSLRFTLFLAVGLISCGLQRQDLTPAANCDLWVGTVSGNDPSVGVQLRLCERDDGHLHGVLQWASMKSGWNERAVVGSYVKDSRNYIQLRDTGFIHNEPNGLWRFCLIDTYNLERRGDEMMGTYISKSCSDFARMILKKK